MKNLSGILNSKIFRMVVAILVGAGAIYLATRDVDFNEVGAVISTVNIWLLVGAFLTVIINLAAKILRWQVLLNVTGERVIYKRLAIVYMGGQLLNFVIPMRAGDLGRAYVVGKTGEGRAFAFGTLVLEKLFDLVAYTLLFSVLLLVLPLPDWMVTAGVSPLPITGLIIAAVLFLFLFSRRIEAMLNKFLADKKDSKLQKVLGWLSSGLSSMESLRNPMDLARIILLTILTWGMAYLNNYLVLEAFNLAQGGKAALLLLIVLQAGISFIYVPGTIGVFEYLCILSLGVFGVARTLAFSYGVMLHATVLIPILIGGLVALVVWRPDLKYRSQGGEVQNQIVSVDESLAE